MLVKCIGPKLRTTMAGRAGNPFTTSPMFSRVLQPSYLNFSPTTNTIPFQCPWWHVTPSVHPESSVAQSLVSCISKYMPWFLFIHGKISKFQKNRFQLFAALCFVMFASLSERMRFYLHVCQSVRRNCVCMLSQSINLVLM